MSPDLLQGAGFSVIRERINDSWAVVQTGLVVGGRIAETLPNNGPWDGPVDRGKTHGFSRGP